MFKASTIYAAYGKKQPAAASQADVRGASQQSVLTGCDPSNSSNAPGSLSSADLQQQELHSLQDAKSSIPNQPLRATQCSNSRAAAPRGSLGTNSTGSSNSAVSFSLEPRSWVQQAADITDDLLDASKYKSLAVYAEVKLAEALDKAAQACPNSIAGAAPEDCEDGQPLPNPLATAVCCELLGELADMCGPFQSTLLKLREALLPSIYSCCSGPSLYGSRPLQFDMLPWFALAGRLRRQNNQLLEQQAAFSLELTQHQEHMAAVEAQVQGLQAALESGTASAAALQATNVALSAERAAAVSEAAAASEEVKKLTGEAARLTAELDDAREQLSSVKEEYSNEQEQWKAQLDVYLQKLHVEAHERTAAVALAAAEQQEVEQKLWEVERKLEEAEQQLQQHSSAQQAGQQQQLQLTPRPAASDWGPAQQLACACKSTAEAVQQLQQQHAAELATLQRQLQLLSALTQPEPDPKPWQLNLRTEACRYFLTELEADPSAQDQCQGSGAQRSKLFAAGLGLGPDVPRFLRWDGQVEVHDVSLQDLEQQVSELWRAKAAYEAANGPCCLLTFLHEHFWSQATAALAAGAAPGGPAQASAATSTQVATAQTAGPAAAQVDGTAGQDGSGSGPASDTAAAEGEPFAATTLASFGPSTSSPDGSRDPTQPTTSTPLRADSAAAGAGQISVAARNTGDATAGAGAASLQQPVAAAADLAADAGYQLYYACCTHRHDSTAVELLWLVLTGQLPEAMLQQQQLQLQALISALRELQAMPAAAAGAGPQEAAAAADQQAGSSLGSSSTTGMSSAPLWSSVEAALQTAFPAKLQQQHKELAGLLAAVCGMRPADSTAHESSISGSFVTTAALAAVVEALQEELHTRFACSTTTLPSSLEASAAATSGDTGVHPDGGSVTTSSTAAVEAGGFRVNRMALRRLIEGLLKQHLDLALQHSQQVMQHVQQLLQEALPSAALASAEQQPSGAAQVPTSPCDEPVWLQIAEYLCSQGLQVQGGYSTGRSTSSSSKAMRSTRGSGAGCAEGEGTTCSTEGRLITAGRADASLLQLLAAVRRAVAVGGVEAVGVSGSAAAASRAVGMLRRQCLLLPPAEAPTP